MKEHPESIQLPSPVGQFKFPDGTGGHVEIQLKRDDLIHPQISGNKWRKLKLNLENARTKRFDTVLSFGGAFSNHLVALAAGCKMTGLKGIGVVRGEDADLSNPTLSACRSFGMTIEKVSRGNYARKVDKAFIQELHNQFGSFYLVPEGGANYHGVVGCMDIVTEAENALEGIDYMCCPMGTGTTVAGIVTAGQGAFKTLGFSPFKDGRFLKDDLKRLLSLVSWNNDVTNDLMNDFELITDFGFGGFGKVNAELIEFVKWLREKTGVQFDYLYNGKMIYGLYRMLKQQRFSDGDRIVVVHTGGIQGNKGIEAKLQ